MSQNKNPNRPNPKDTRQGDPDVSAAKKEQSASVDQTVPTKSNTRDPGFSSLVGQVLELSHHRAQSEVPSLSALLDDYEILDGDTMIAEPNTEPQAIAEAEEQTKARTQSGHPYPSSSSSIAVSAGDRYQDLSLLGSGGMGNVRRVRDRLLNRTVAMKILHRRFLPDKGHVLRFIQEAQVVSQLQHPNILPVHDLGVLENGDVFFTMAEIRGKSLSHYIDQVHASPVTSGWFDGKSNWNLHRLISAVNDACKGVAHAHESGVFHRDLKPDNIMIDSFGEVLVVDWGLAKVVSETNIPDSSVVTTGSEQSAMNTMVGSIYGTPAYLAPELATGSNTTPSKKTDIYALGAILYEVLRGRRAFKGNNVHEILTKVLDGKVDPFEQIQDDQISDSRTRQEPVYLSQTGRVVPTVLVNAAMKSLAHDPKERFDDVKELVEIIGGWLDGSRKRELALKEVNLARELGGELLQKAQRASELRGMVQDATTNVETWESSATKEAIWQLEDEALRLDAEAQLLRVKQKQAYRNALAIKSDLVEAHVALSEMYREEHEGFEKSGNVRRAKEVEFLLREHVDALPNSLALKMSLVRYLRGFGELDLITQPANAVVNIKKFILHKRRLIEKPVGKTMSSPIEGLPIEIGSYVVEVSLAGYHAVRLPIFNRRAETITCQDPDGNPAPLELLPMGTLSHDDCYVPSGWTFLGGDPNTPNSLPPIKVWIDGFVIKKFPTTHQEYLIFLNDLIASNQREEALLHVPREQSSSEEELGRMVYELDDLLGFSLPTNPDGREFFPTQPVTMIQWRSARAYARWYSERTGLPWSLPLEFEWEKAARGVDGRFYPWGDHHDPSWSCMKDSHQGEIKMQVVDSFPIDESVYGVRGTAGNTRDWCLDKFRDQGPPIRKGRLLMPSEKDLADEGFKSTRGGSYGNSASRARSADRDWWFPDRSYIGRGFRLLWRLSDRNR